MKRSAPIHQLKRQARLLSRSETIPLHAALDRVAAREGFGSWSLLATKRPIPAGDIYARLRPGDLLLVAARPGHGKTVLALNLAMEAMKSGNRGFFFTLEYSEREWLDHFHRLGVSRTRSRQGLVLDASDDIDANYIVTALRDAPSDTLAVIDYLQLLDQKRANPELMDQVRQLKFFAREKGLTLVFISQIDRSYDPSTKRFPNEIDVRLPNPLDLSLFDKTCFLHDGEARFRSAS